MLCWKGMCMHSDKAMKSLTCTKAGHACVQMEGMVTDLQLAREKQQAFETWQRQNSKSSPLDLSVTVLTTGFWPAFKGHSLLRRSYQ